MADSSRKYIIGVREVNLMEYIVEADSPESARGEENIG